MALTKEQIKEFEEREKAANDSYGFRSVADDIVEFVIRLSTVLLNRSMVNNN